KQSKSLVWLATVSGNAAGAVAVEGDRAYVYTDKGKLYSLKVGNGKIAWQADVSGYWMSPPAFDGNFIYVGSNDGKLYALDRESGVVLWSYDTGGDYVTSPAISGGRLVFTASFPGKDPSTQLIPLDKRLSAGAVDSAFKKEQLEKWLAATETLNGGTDVAAGAISAEYTGLASVNWPYGVPVKLLAVLGDQAGAGSAADIGFSAIFKVIAGSLFVVTVLVPMLFPIGGVFLLLFVWRSAGLLLFAKEGTGLAGAVQAARRPASLESIKGSYFRAVDAVLNDPLLLAPSLGAGILLLVYATVIGGAFGTGYTGVRIGTTALWLFGAALSAIVETMTFSLYQEVGDKAINRLADAFSNARRYFWRLFFCQVVLLGCLALGLLIVSYGILLDSSVAFALAFILWVLLALGSYADRFVLRGESAWRSLSESALWTIRNFKAVNRFTILTGLLAILVAFIASALNVLPYGLFATVILSAVGAVLLTILRADFFGVRREG
ncbi:MAG: PQQ-like beta-propeller repeat protein, partial [Chloroflexi bacterium]|nr:PQQ-like beta-propeller repeat protein [Chloroflexota bacterium]